MPDRKPLAERLAERRAQIVNEELNAPEQLVSRGQNVPIVQLPRPASVYEVVAVVGQLADYSRINTVMALLDRWNPEVIVIGDANGPDRMARAWAITRERTFIEIAAQWEQLGAAAGPLRSQKILDVTRKIAAEEGKTMALVIFMNQGAINSFPARNIRPLLNAAESRNQLYRSQPGMGHMVMPVHFGDEWMHEDFLAANPVGELGSLDLALPSARTAAVDPATGEILPDVDVEIVTHVGVESVNSDEVPVDEADLAVAS